MSKNRITIAIGTITALALAALGFLVGPLAINTPQVISTIPADGANSANPQAAIEIELSQVVQPSALSGISIDPPAELQVQSEGNRVRITAVGGLQYNQAYQLTIAGLRNQLGRTMEQPVTVRFRTTDYASVRQFSPADASEDQPLRTPITVEFALPVVSAEQVAAAAADPRSADALPQPISLVPTNDPSTPVKGVGRWLSPTLFGFYPEADLRAASEYRVEVRPNISGDGQAQLQQAASWRFRTAAPLLVGVRPFAGEQDVTPTNMIEVRLAADVDPERASAAFSLRPTVGGGTVTGTFEPLGDGQNGFRFRPNTPLNHGTRYEASLAAGITSRFGAPLNQEAQTWQFSTIGDPIVLQVEPLPDATEVPTTTRRISVRFNHPIVALTDLNGQAALPNPLTITPPLAGVGRWLDTSTYVFSPTVALDPSSRYQAVVAAGLQDQTGGTLQSSYSWSFATIQPEVIDYTPYGEDVSPNTTITVFFNQPMDPADLQANLVLIRDDPFEIIDVTKQIRGHIVTMTPSQPLLRGQGYRIVAPIGLKSANGTGSLQSPTSVLFRVAPLPALIESEPQNGDQQANTGGTIKLSFSTAMDWESVEQNLTITPRPTEVYTDTYEQTIYLYSNLEPESSYTITIGAAAKDIYGVPIGSDQVVQFRTAALSPSFNIVSNSSGRMVAYNANVNTRVPIQVVNYDQIDYTLSQIGREQAIDLATIYDAWLEYRAPEQDQVLSGTLPTAGTRNQPQLAFLDLGKLKPGIYLLDLSSSGDIRDRTLLVVSPYAITIKHSEGRLFVWVADLASGKPVGGLELELLSYDYQNQNTLTPTVIGRTGSDGVLTLSLSDIERFDTLYLSTPGDQPELFATTEWSAGIDPWNFNIPIDYVYSDLFGTFITDKPIYRPDQTVRVRGVVRNRIVGELGRADSYRLPQGQVDLSISDPDGNTIITRTLTLSDFGTFQTEIPLDRATPVGNYTIYASLTNDPNNSIYGSFNVAEYRVPTFDIAITPSTSDAIEGDTISAEVLARYFAGGNLSNAPVRWRLLEQPLFFFPNDLDDFTFSSPEDADYWYYGEGAGFDGGSLLSDGTGSTDSQGRFSINLPATSYRSSTDNQGNQVSQKTRQLTLEVEITDLDGQVITSQTRINLHPAEFYIGLKSESYLGESGKPQQVSLITIDPQGAIAPNRSLNVEIFRREWYNIRERGDDGRFYWTSSYTDTLEQAIPARSDGQGLATISFSPQSNGVYRIVASGKDGQNRTAVSAIFTWIYTGNVFWGVDDTNRVDLISDKRTYKPGESAKVLVTAPYPNMTGILTIERSNVIEYRLVTITGTSGVFDIPISGDYAPNVFVSLTLIKTPTCAAPDSGSTLPACQARAEDLAVPELRFGLINLGVTLDQQQLNVTLTPDKSEVGPRDSVTYTIRTTDSSGAGVPAEVSLALVDKAVLSLADDPNTTLNSSFYSRRGLAIQTANTLTALIDRVTIKLQEGDKGGDGMTGGGGSLGSIGVRNEFPDTAYWNPSLVTAADGSAQVTITLPDNLTTWRLDARAITNDTRIGISTVDIVASKPLFIRPALPRFLTAGDQPLLQAVVQNNTANPIAATVTLVIAQDSLLQTSAPLEQSIHIPANSTQLLRWPASVNPQAPEDAIITMQLQVLGGEYQDAVEISLPVKRFVTPEVVATAGQVYDQTIESIATTQAEGQLDLEIVPSLAAGIYTGLDYLRAYPYECTEQTVSKFLPNAVTYRLLKQAGRDDPTLRQNLESQLSSGMQRLSAMQNLDGGWGWWQGEASQPYLTAYVVQGLIEAQKAGLTIDQAMLTSGIDHLKRALDGDTLTIYEGSENVRAYILYVLADAGQPDRARSITLFEQRTKLAIDGKAYLLMSLTTIGGESDRSRLLISDLMSAAILTTTEAHWEEREIYYWYMSSNTRSTALSLQALVRADPQNFLIPNAVRYLMGLRDRGHWQTTKETAISSMALAEYVAQSGELNANYRYQATLGNQTLSEGQIDQNNLSSPIRVAQTLQAGASSQLTLTKQGDGRLYYTLRLRTYADAASVQALERGIQIERRYEAVDPVTLQSTGQLITQAKQSEVIQVHLTIRLSSDMNYLAIEDFLPAGLEPLDSSLKTSSSLAASGDLEQQDEFDYWSYFSSSAIRDDRVALFATEIADGTYTYTYLARATTPGIYQTLPTVGYQMYAPEVFGRSAGSVFTVTEP
ncbi:MAG: hypothetical protein OHK0050_28650 [Roseiflexaceae bacterium]